MWLIVIDTARRQYDAPVHDSDPDSGSALSQGMLTLWSWSWEGPKPGRVQQRLVLRLSEVALSDETRLLRLDIGASVGRMPWLWRRMVWTAIVKCSLNLPIQHVIQLHAVLARWLGIPVPSSRLPSARCGGDATAED